MMDSQLVLPSRAVAALFSLLAVTLLGCGGPRTSAVEGVVLLDGKPLVGAAIQFVPQGTGQGANGETDKNGEFSMSTFKPRDGVVAGDYKVVITQLAKAEPTPYASAEEAMAAAGKAPPPKPSGPTLPEKYTRPDQTPLAQTVPVKEKLKFDLKSK